MMIIGTYIFQMVKPSDCNRLRVPNSSTSEGSFFRYSSKSVNSFILYAKTAFNIATLGLFLMSSELLSLFGTKIILNLAKVRSSFHVKENVLNWFRYVRYIFCQVGKRACTTSDKNIPVQGGNFKKITGDLSNMSS